MPSRAANRHLAVVLGGLLVLAGCRNEAPTSEPEPFATQAEAVPEVTPSADASGSAGGLAAELDAGALQERQDPKRLLRFYADAVRIGDWQAAARVWSLDAQMTPEKLEAEFGGVAGPKIAVGKGDSSGAAGMLYYEAPVVIDFPDGRASLRGTIVLRRANDAPGASAEQLVWRIERSSTVPQ